MCVYVCMYVYIVDVYVCVRTLCVCARVYVCVCAHVYECSCFGVKRGGGL